MFVFLSIATLGCAALLYNLSSSSCYHDVGDDYSLPDVTMAILMIIILPRDVILAGVFDDDNSNFPSDDDHVNHDDHIDVAQG